MFSTNEAAKKLGLAAATLSRYIILGKVPSPKIVQAGLSTVHAWTDEEIEAVRKLLPKLKNGRKTRYKKKRSAISSQQKTEERRRGRLRSKNKKFQKQKKKK